MADEQKANDQVRVNVQLIRAATDEHLWAESYNRKLDDVFAVEGEVAGEIADQLNAQASSPASNAPGIADRLPNHPRRT